MNEECDFRQVRLECEQIINDAIEKVKVSGANAKIATDLLPIRNNMIGSITENYSQKSPAYFSIPLVSAVRLWDCFCFSIHISAKCIPGAISQLSAEIIAANAQVWIKRVGEETIKLCEQKLCFLKSGGTEQEFYKSLKHDIELFPIIHDALFLDVVSDTHPPVIAFVGRSSAGKSTLINAILKEKIAPEGDLPDTTQDLQSYRRNGGVWVYDTPGIDFAPKLESITRSYLGLMLSPEQLSLVRNTAAQAEYKKPDVIVFVASTESVMCNTEKMFFTDLQKLEIPVIVALNKIDLRTDHGSAIVSRIKEQTGTTPFPISAKTGMGLNQLVCEIYYRLPEEYRSPLMDIVDKKYKVLVDKQKSRRYSIVQALRISFDYFNHRGRQTKKEEISLKSALLFLHTLITKDTYSLCETDLQFFELDFEKTYLHLFSLFPFSSRFEASIALIAFGYTLGQYCEFLGKGSGKKNEASSLEFSKILEDKRIKLLTCLAQFDSQVNQPRQSDLPDLVRTIWGHLSQELL